jgi:hypothetical protein
MDIFLSGNYVVVTLTRSSFSMPPPTCDVIILHLALIVLVLVGSNGLQNERSKEKAKKPEETWKHQNER